MEFVRTMYRAYFVEDKPKVLEAFMGRPIFLECGFINAGHSVDPLEAIKEIQKMNPDVVFTDLKMPGLTGIELMERLKSGGYEGEFVLVSAYGEFEASRSFYKMDGLDYLIKPVSDRDLLTLLETLTGRLAAKRADANPVKGTPSPELNKITAYLNGSISEKHTLESLSAKFDVTPNHICKLFSKVLDTTFKAYITKIRMEEAATLLKTTKKSVNEIAAICGYHNYFYFCRVFREVYTCTPTEYREAP